MSKSNCSARHDVPREGDRRGGNRRQKSERRGGLRWDPYKQERRDGGDRRQTKLEA
jgi:hypothetical protein